MVEKIKLKARMINANVSMNPWLAQEWVDGEYDDTSAMKAVISALQSQLALEDALTKFVIFESDIMASLHTTQERSQAEFDAMREEGNDMRAAIAHAFANARELLNPKDDGHDAAKAFRIKHPGQQAN